LHNVVFRAIGITLGVPVAALAAAAAAIGTSPCFAARIYPNPDDDDVKFPKTTAAQATANLPAEALRPGAPAKRCALMLERADFGATRSAEIDVLVMDVAVLVMKDALDCLKTEVDSVEQRSPLPSWGPAAGTSGAPGARRLAGVGNAGGGGRRREGGAGAGMTGLPANRCEPPKGRAQPPRPASRAPRGAGLPRPEGAAGDSRPDATRRLLRVSSATVTPPRL